MFVRMKNVFFDLILLQHMLAYNLYIYIYIYIYITKNDR